MMTNLEIASAIEQMKAAVDADKHDGVRRYVLNKLLQAGIIDAMPEAMLDPYRPCPTDWTAFQISYFDNGEPEVKRNRYVKGADGKSVLKIERTKMRFGGNLRIWTRSQINFKNAKTVAWEANFHCWTGEQALKVMENLVIEGYLGKDPQDRTVQLMKQCVAQGGDDLRYSVPLLRTTGTRWMKNHILITRIGNDYPDKAIVYFPGQGFATENAMASTMSSGDALKGNAILQARLARNSDLAPWATEIHST